MHYPVENGRVNTLTRGNSYFAGLFVKSRLRPQSQCINEVSTPIYTASTKTRNTWNTGVRGGGGGGGGGGVGGKEGTGFR